MAFFPTAAPVLSGVESIPSAPFVHNLIISEVVPSPDDAPDPQTETYTLHYWDHTRHGASAQLVLSGAVDKTPWDHVKGFSTLGKFSLNLGLQLDDDPEDAGCLFHTLVTSFLEARDTAGWQSVEDMIQSIMSYLQSSAAIEHISGLTTLQLYRVTVRSPLARSPLDGPSGRCAFKWVKQNSMYDPKSGFWELEIEEALEQGMWLAGRMFNLVVQGLTEKQFLHLAEPGRKCTAIPEAEGRDDIPDE